MTGTCARSRADNGKPGTRIVPRKWAASTARRSRHTSWSIPLAATPAASSGLAPVPSPNCRLGPHLQLRHAMVAAARGRPRPIGIWLTVRDAKLERERLARRGRNDHRGTQGRGRGRGHATPGEARSRQRRGDRGRALSRPVSRPPSSRGQIQRDQRARSGHRDEVAVRGVPQVLDRRRAEAAPCRAAGPRPRPRRASRARPRPRTS